ncbi:MAG: hypothetical protein IJ620_04035 [Bacteroidales bacterium]|nr:hypothetical protein [Bacteroidales bacterium]
MQLKLSFQEIENMIASKTGKHLPMTYGGTPHSVRISYDVNVIFKTTSVGLDITIDSIEGDNIYLSYGGGSGIEFMVRTALSHYKDQPGADIIEPLDGSRILLRLGKNPQLAQLFERITLQDIRFDEQGVMIDFVPKGL